MWATDWSNHLEGIQAILSALYVQYKMNMRMAELTLKFDVCSYGSTELQSWETQSWRGLELPPLEGTHLSLASQESWVNYYLYFYFRQGSSMAWGLVIPERADSEWLGQVFRNLQRLISFDSCSAQALVWVVMRQSSIFDHRYALFNWHHVLHIPYYVSSAPKFAWHSKLNCDNSLSL